MEILMPRDDELIVLIMAAGKGTRMKSDLPKVLHCVSGKPMLEYVIEKAEHLKAGRIIVIVGYQAEKVMPLIEGRTEFVLQEPQLGTGHAVMCAAPKFEASTGTLLLLSGDVPLLTKATLLRLVEVHKKEANKATVLTAILDDPAGYGRILRDGASGVDRIVEHKDASEQERAINEINTGLYCFDIPALLTVLKEISNNNAQGEYYVTDAIGLMRMRGWKVGAVVAGDHRETEGINTKEQLLRAERDLAEISYDN